MPVVLIQDQVAFLSSSQTKAQTLRTSPECKHMLLVSTDLHKKYMPFANDFGPVSLGVVHGFCHAPSKQIHKEQGSVLVYCFDESYQDQANTSFLLGSLLVLCMGC
jgi:hypothetical protein